MVRFKSFEEIEKETVRLTSRTYKEILEYYLADIRYFALFKYDYFKSHDSATKKSVSGWLSTMPREIDEIMIKSNECRVMANKALLMCLEKAYDGLVVDEWCKENSMLVEFIPYGDNWNDPDISQRQWVLFIHDEDGLASIDEKMKSVEKKFNESINEIRAV